MDSHVSIHWLTRLVAFHSFQGGLPVAWAEPALSVILSEAKNLKPLSQYYVYILTNASRRLYTGVTNDLYRRVYEHKCKLALGFTSKYNLTWLVYYETTSDVNSAIAREK